MNPKEPFIRSSRMSPEAYAGFLKLWLTPHGKADPNSAEVEAYLRHVNEREPLPRHIRRALGQNTDQAA